MGPLRLPICPHVRSHQPLNSFEANLVGWFSRTLILFCLKIATSLTCKYRWFHLSIAMGPIPALPTYFFTYKLTAD